MKNAQALVRKFMLERGWQKQLPADMAKSIVIEAAELLEHFQWSSPSLKGLKKKAEKVEDINKELADVFVYALAMAVLLDADAEEIVEKKLELAAKKYPPKMFKNSPYSQKVQDKYWEIKKEYRIKEK